MTKSSAELACQRSLISQHTTVAPTSSAKASGRPITPLRSVVSQLEFVALLEEVPWTVGELADGAEETRALKRLAISGLDGASMVHFVDFLLVTLPCSLETLDIFTARIIAAEVGASLYVALKQGESCMRTLRSLRLFLYGGAAPNDIGLSVPLELAKLARAHGVAFEGGVVPQHRANAAFDVAG